MCAVGTFWKAGSKRRCRWGRGVMSECHWQESARLGDRGQGGASFEGIPFSAHPQPPQAPCPLQLPLCVRHGLQGGGVDSDCQVCGSTRIVANASQKSKKSTSVAFYFHLNGTESPRGQCVTQRQVNSCQFTSPHFLHLNDSFQKI